MRVFKALREPAGPVESGPVESSAAAHYHETHTSAGAERKDRPPRALVELPDEAEGGFDRFAAEEYFDFPDEDEPWRESLPEAVRDEDDDAKEPFRVDRHPLQQRAMDLLLRIDDLLAGVKERGSHVGTLCRGAGDMMVGLAQALSGDRCGHRLFSPYRLR